ncbi:MAG: hypothetical protein IPK15_12130 [Verrucomicrobia bacterium]|nr:hypothetical protein [Verrucomicrobiota bacterium]
MMRAIPILSLWAVLGLVSARAQHAGDILIGQTATGALGAANLPERTIFLSPVSSGPFRGWSSTVLGFDGILDTNAANVLNPLSAGANVFLEVVSIEAGLSLRSFTAPATVFADDVGERLRIGSTGNLHNHPIIFIDSAVVGTDFTGQRSVILRLVDTGTAGLRSSTDYAMTFSPVLPTSLSIRRTAEGAIISFETSAGLGYQIQAAPNPAGPWVSEGSPIAGTGVMAEFAPIATSSNSFFRVRSFPDN